MSGIYLLVALYQKSQSFSALTYVYHKYRMNTFSMKYSTCVPRGNKGFRNLIVNFVRKRTDPPQEHYTIGDEKPLLFIGEIKKA